MNVSPAAIDDGRAGGITLPKWTSSKTTSFGWLIPQNLVTKAMAVMKTKTIL